MGYNDWCSIWHRKNQRNRWKVEIFLIRSNVDSLLTLNLILIWPWRNEFKIKQYQLIIAKWLWPFNRRVQYCAKVMRTKFVEICPLFSQIFKEISNDISRSFFKNSKNFRRNVAWPIKNPERLTKFWWNEVSNERNIEEFSKKRKETWKFRAVR